MYMRMNPILPAADVIRSATLYNTTTNRSCSLPPATPPKSNVDALHLHFQLSITPLVELSSSGK